MIIFVLHEFTPNVQDSLLLRSPKFRFRATDQHRRTSLSGIIVEYIENGELDRFCWIQWDVWLQWPVAFGETRFGSRDGLEKYSIIKI